MKIEIESADLHRDLAAFVYSVIKQEKIRPMSMQGLEKKCLELSKALVQEYIDKQDKKIITL